LGGIASESDQVDIEGPNTVEIEGCLEEWRTWDQPRRAAVVLRQMWRDERKSGLCEGAKENGDGKESSDNQLS